MRTKKKTYILLIAACLLICCAIGGTLAWLTATTEDVKNTFTTSNIEVELKETTSDYKMVPGWTIAKDPKVTVKAGSEDCWLFVEVTESTAPKLQDYIAYSVDTGNDQWTQGEGTGDGKNGIPKNVYYRKVTGVAATGEGTSFEILCAGSETVDGISYSWKKNEVLVRPDVTKTQMKALEKKDAAQPALTFKAYAVQLWKTNKPADGATEEQITAAQFTAAEAWTQASK